MVSREISVNLMFAGGVKTNFNFKILGGVEGFVEFAINVHLYRNFPINARYLTAYLYLISLFALILILLGGIGYLARKVHIRRGKGISDEEFVTLIKTLEEIEEAEKMEEPERKRKLKSLRQMYREIYQKLLKHYNLKPSITPRELINRLRGENFSYHLEKITHLHERYVYGKKPLKRHGVLEFLRNVAGFIVSFIVREEL